MLKFVVDDLQAVPEPMRSLYEARDGKHYLKTDGEPPGYEPAAKVKEFRDNNVALLKAKAALEKALGGRKPEEVEQILAKMAEDETKGAEARGEFEKLKQKLVSQHQQELEAKTKREQQLLGVVDRLVRQARAVEAITKAEGNPTLLLKNVLDFLKPKELAKDDGSIDFQLEVVDGKGGTRYKNGQGDPFTVEDLIAELKSNKDFAGAFKGSGAAGSGAPGSKAGAGGAGGGTQDFSELSPVERLRIARRQGK